MRLLALSVAVLLSVPAAAQELVSPPGAVRLLVLDVVARDGITADDRELMQALVTNALRGKESLLVATDDDVRRRAPMEADRLGRCEDELCLYELASALDADWVVFSSVRAAENGVVMELGSFARARGEIVGRESVEAASVAAGSASATAAMERLLEPILAEAKPQLFELPLFLGGTGVLAAGLLVFAGAGGWALELESNLATPGRHPDDKTRALEQGPVALAVAGVGAAIALVGAGMVTWAIVSAE